MIFLFQTHHSQSICLSELTRESPHQVLQFRVKWLKELKVSLPWLTPEHTTIHSLKSMGSFARCVIIRSRQFCPAVHNVKELAVVDDIDLLFLNDMDKTWVHHFKRNTALSFSNESCDRTYKRSSWPHLSGYLTKYLYICSISTDSCE